jgi:HSP20 family protein
LFDPFFLEPDTDRYFFPRLLLDNKDDEEDDNNNQVAERGLIRAARNVNMTEDDDAWTMYMDMPGVKTPDVEMEENQGVLTVKAVRKTGDKVTARYMQHFTLDPRSTNVDALSAELTDGVLVIKVPKKPAPEPVTVQVVKGDAPEAAADSNEFRCTMELPGIKAEDLKVEFRDDSLFLEAERKKGRYTSKVQRMFTVGRTVDTGHAKAYLADGVLTFVAPRVEKPEPKVHKITLGMATPPALKSEKE